jgi:hypothetical protein
VVQAGKTIHVLFSECSIIVALEDIHYAYAGYAYAGVCTTRSPDEEVALDIRGYKVVATDKRCAVVPSTPKVRKWNYLIRWSTIIVHVDRECDVARKARSCQEDCGFHI